MDSHTLELVLALTAMIAVVALLAVHSRKGRTEDRARAYLAGVTYVLSDDPDAAIAELSRAAQLSTQTLETYFALGALFRRKGDLERAIRLHQNILLRPGLSREVRRRAQLSLAQDYRRSGLRDKAVECLERILGEEPEHKEALAALRQLHQEAGELAHAAELQARVIRITGAGHELLGHLLAAHAHRLCAERPEEAVEVARRAAELLPGHPHPLFVLALSLLAAGRRQEAAPPLEQAIFLEPELAPGAVGALRACLGSARAAALLRERVETAGEAGPSYSLALACCHRDAGRSEEAIRILRTVVELTPWRWEARRELGALLLAQDRSEELRADYQEILGRLGDPVPGFSCTACSQKLPEHSFCCPACGIWDRVRRDERRAGAPPRSGAIGI